MEEISAKLNTVGASVDDDVVVQLEVGVDPRRETRGIAHRGERIAQVDLRVAEVGWIGGGSQQAAWLKLPPLR